jgi:tetratricopeptide (TPR) repeat protein
MKKCDLREKTVLFIILLFLGVFSSFLHAFPQTEMELQYPTLISVQYKAGSVLIYFEPIGGEEIQYRIYRSNTPIENKHAFEKAIAIAEITEEKIPYKDTPHEDGKYYYAVTAIKEGKEFIELVPFQNISLRPVDYSPVPDPIQSIKVSLLGNHQVGVSFAPVRENYTYMLYVSSQKIEKTADMNPFSVLSGKDNQFKMEIEEDIPYYFFVSTANRLKIENKTIIPGKNATSHALIIKKPEGKPREVKKKPPPLSPGKLIEDNLRNNFYKGKYTKAIKDFQTILTRYKLSASQIGTTHFYMGQCYYYKGNYEKAVHYFILSKENGFYKGKADIWINRCLESVE